MMENNVVLIAGEFVLAERLQPRVQRVDLEPQEDAADCFQEAVNAFDGDAYTKRIVKQDVAEPFFRHLVRVPDLRLRNMLMTSSHCRETFTIVPSRAKVCSRIAWQQRGGSDEVASAYDLCRHFALCVHRASAG